jgi:phage-related holin
MFKLWRFTSTSWFNPTSVKAARKMKWHSINEFMSITKSVLSLNLKIVPFTISVFGGFTLGSISGFVSNWIFDPAVSYYTLMLLICCDHVTGMCIAWKNNHFETRKATRIFWTLLSHTALLAFATNLSKGSNAIYWLNEGIFVPLVVVNLISLVKNLSLLGFIKKSFASILYKKIDVYKNEYIQKSEQAKPGNDGC